VLEVLGIGSLFDAVHTIEHTRFRPKPSLSGMRALLARERLLPQRTVLVEDMLINLVTARRLGMKTVWITRESRRPAWLDAKLSSVLELPRVADNL
jgi:putative hydrolase of the HAD superfamily